MTPDARAEPEATSTPAACGLATPRTLHILDQRDPPAGLAATLALIADTQQREPANHRTLLLGGQTIRDAAQCVGLTNFTLQPSPHALTRAALALRPRPRNSPGPHNSRNPHNLLASADRVECWSVHAATYAADLGCKTFHPRFGQVGDTPFADQTIDRDRLASCDRDALRCAWNLAPQDRVVALLTDHPEKQSALPPALITALTQDSLRPPRFSGRGNPPTQPPRLRLLIPPNLAHLADAERLYTDAGYPALLLQDPNLAYPWQVLPAADAALLLDPAAASLAALWARAAHLPIAAPTDPDLPPKQLAHQLQHILTPGRPASAGADPTQ